MVEVGLPGGNQTGGFLKLEKLKGEKKVTRCGPEKLQEAENAEPPKEGDTTSLSCAVSACFTDSQGKNPSSNWLL